MVSRAFWYIAHEGAECSAMPAHKKHLMKISPARRELASSAAAQQRSNPVTKR